MSDVIARNGHIQSSWLARADMQAALFVLVLSVFARLLAFTPGFSIDDYIHIHLPESVSFELVAAQGRPLVTPVLWFMRAFGMAPATAMPMSTLSLILALVAAGVVTCRLMNLSDRFLECTAVIAFVSLFPYQAEIFTFRTASVTLALPLGLIFAAMAFPLDRWWQWLAGVTAVVAALSIYQVVLSYAAVALVMVALHHALQGSGRETWRHLARLVLLLVVSVLAYGAVLWVTLQEVAYQNPQMGMLSTAEEVSQRLGQLAELGRLMLYRAEPVLPRATKLLLLLMAALSVGAVLVRRPRQFRGDSAAARLGILAVAIVLATGACLGMLAVLRVWWPQPRVLAQVSLFWGGLVALGLRYAAPRLRLVLATLGGLALCSFIGINHQIFSEQLRLNARDRDVAVRILEEIEEQMDAATLQGVYLSGGRWGYDQGFHTVLGNLNVSALAVAWAKPYLLMEVSGERYAPPSAALVQQADTLCATSPRWPDQRAITRINDFAVVCLESP